MSLSPEQLDQCVAYFTTGGPAEWIGGGITVAAILFFTLTKKSLPSVIKSLGTFLMKQSVDKEPLK